MKPTRPDALEAGDVAKDGHAIAVPEDDIRLSARTPATIYDALSDTLQNFLGERIEEEGYPVAVG